MGFQNYGGRYRDNDFFQELWMQLAASGTGQFYYFAPWIFGSTMREHQLVSDSDHLTACKRLFSLGCVAHTKAVFGKGGMERKPPTYCTIARDAAGEARGYCLYVTFWSGGVRGLVNPDDPEPNGLNRDHPTR